MQDDKKPNDTNNDPSTGFGSFSNISDSQTSPATETSINDSSLTTSQTSSDTNTQTDSQIGSTQQTSANYTSDSSQGSGSAVVSSPHAPQKYGGKKIIATIFGIMILVAAVATGVYLVQRQQDLRERAASGSACDHSPDCILVDNAPNSGSRTVERQIVYVDITDKEYHRYEPGEIDDECRRVNISGNTVSWERYGDGPNCKDVSNVQIWMGNGGPTINPTKPPCVTQPPNITAECSEVKAYDTSWNLLSQTQLNQLEAGTTIRFAVSGTTSSGAFDRARFSVNSTNLGETTLKKPGSEEFYIEYTIQENTNAFNVSAQIHHSDIGWF